MLHVQGRSGETRPDQTGTDPQETLSSKLTQPWEQLEKQLANEKDPEIKALLQKAAELNKSRNAAAAKELPERSEGLLVAPIKRLTTAVDKQQEILAAASAKMQDLRKDLAMAYVDLAHLPEEILLVPKKIPANILGTSMVDPMKIVHGQQ
eukprot:3666579-Amphidinium_carterae.1